MSKFQTDGRVVTLQSLGDNITEATVTRWLKAAGDQIEVDEALVEVATDKVDTEILSPASGTVLELLAMEDEVISVGGALAIIGALDREATPAPDAPQPVSIEAHDFTETHQPPALLPEPDSAPTLSVPSSGDRVERLPRIRQTIAKRMLESLHTTAQLTTVVETDVTGIAQLRSAHKADFQLRTGLRLSFLPFFVKATVEALTEHPALNCSVNTECTEVTYHSAVHLGMAVDSERGLMVPVIRDAHKLTITALAQAISSSADQVRAATISPNALTGGTFTITNTGSRGALFDTPILNRPQSGILGTGAVVERVVPRRDPSGAVDFGVRSMVYLSISYDHRIVDGADAARFLGTIKRRLENGFSSDELV
ncbi:2-oxo acid dehydrogenase subunit E2 [Nocardia salmonicida]|uniref:2-oxo acid dehydrogenase subunit E2 n=1 Tax=Nocardia salmonicida TaxID=53431 RepID=UPI002E2D7090|nr:2-oxo acid dehydrogenase subunit E2 [Nocardia salmonicida]